MDEKKFKQTLNEFDSTVRKRTMKKIYTWGGFILIIIAFLVTVSILDKKQQNDESFLRDKKDFETDSLWLSNVLITKPPDGQYPGQLKELEHRIKNNSYASAENKTLLLNCLNSIKVNVDTGFILYDEFDRATVIKSKTKTVTVNFTDYDKYSVRNEYRGFANNKTRKAQRLKDKYPTWDRDDCLTVSAGKIYMGMTTEMVREAWGRPQDINRTVGSWGVHEQWVYGLRNYLYFEDGKLTSWQD